MGTTATHFRLSRLKDSAARALAEAPGLVMKCVPLVVGSARYPAPQSVALPKFAANAIGRARLCRADFRCSKDQVAAILQKAFLFFEINRPSFSPRFAVANADPILQMIPFTTPWWNHGAQLLHG